MIAKYRRAARLIASLAVLALPAACAKPAAAPEVDPAAATAEVAAPEATEPAVADEREVAIYASVDQVFAEPILDAFQEETGIQVNAVYDVEAAKTTGMVGRLIEEKGRPLADVWWSGEFSQTVSLADEGVLAAYTSPNAARIPDGYKDPGGLWTGFGGRARILLVNDDLVAEADRPAGLADLAGGSAEGSQVGIAYPLFGTTSTHAAALYAERGPAEAKAFFQGLADAGLQVVDGNGMVRDMVVAGQLAYGLTDTDDACGAIAKGAPVTIVVPDQGPGGAGTLIIPNTVGLVAGGPNPDSGKLLVDYLLSEATEKALVEAGWFQLGLSGGLADTKCGLPGDIRGMDVSLAEVAGQTEPAMADLKEIFVR